jgi:hypothetical protein
VQADDSINLRKQQKRQKQKQYKRKKLLEKKLLDKQLQAKHKAKADAPVAVQQKDAQRTPDGDSSTG